MGILDKLSLKKIKDGLTRTRNDLLGKILNLFGTTRAIDANFFTNLEEILISADVGVDMTDKIISNLKERLKIERINDYVQLL
ncbi:signal recognition particle receptor subunit alpha, partial [Candidatus Kryptonium thompsonii]|uniref:signal recognition particle receptor subunit alpha n=1 Tax=Candidatus Kryptonium thompsonii TaxID=1633631 RepID=UPI000707275F